MSRRSLRHTADEFGRPGSGSATTGLDGPLIGAGAAIAVDALVERESGVTPPPPPVSLKALIIGLVVMFLLGLLLLAALFASGLQRRALQTDTYRMQSQLIGDVRS